MFRLFLISLSVFFISVTYGQTELSTKSKKAQRLYGDGMALIQMRQIPDAANLFQQAVDKDEKFVEAHYYLGYCYKILRNNRKAQLHLEKAFQLDPENPRIQGINYHLGEVYFYQNRYAEALPLLKKYLEGNPRPNIRVQIEILVKNAEYAVQNLENKLEFEPNPLGSEINKFVLQYFPVLTVDQQQLFFTRRLGVTPNYDEDIVVTNKLENGKWSDPVSVSDKINTRYNEGTCTISADGRMLIFTSCLGRQNVGSCDLFVSYKQGSDWSVPKNLGSVVNSRAWDSQPALSADGRTLFFVSDRKGGYGGRDIWKTTKDQTSKWTKPVNLGLKVNTGREEVSPFIHPNNQTLYFASRGWPGFGGFDIYFSEYGETGWSTPENIGYPINNSDDQVSLFITVDGKKGYYSHETIDMGIRMESRIFEFDVPNSIRVVNKSNYVKGIVYDEVTKELLEAKIELYDLNDQNLESIVESDRITGKYIMVLTEGSEYALYVNKKGYLFKSYSFNYEEHIDRQPIHIDIYLQPISKGTKTVLKNIFFDFDKYELKPKSEVELQKVISFLNQNPGIKIEIEGHTDNQGNETYNLDLSDKRANAVYSYLIQNGINAQYLTFKGYGQSQPLVPNNSEENYAQNRRIEFKIM